MRSLVCQWVPALLLTSFVVGCSCGESHMRDDAGPTASDAWAPLVRDGGDYGCTCCDGTSFLTSGPAACETECAFRCPDAGPLPDAGSCGPRAAEVVCFDHVRAGTPTSVDITLVPTDDDCFCEQELTCEVALDPSGGLGLRTALCPETPICRACFGPPVGSCELPALDEGPLRVNIEGEPALDLTVTPMDVIPERADVCVRTAQIDSCGAIWDPMQFVSDRACHPSWVLPGARVTIDVQEACGGCMQIGPCEVMVLDRTIFVRPTVLPNSCDIACDPACHHTEHRCVTPPLEPGLYTVAVDGLTVTDDGPPSTIDVSPMGVSVETCRGSRS